MHGSCGRIRRYRNGGTRSWVSLRSCSVSSLSRCGIRRSTSFTLTRKDGTDRISCSFLSGRTYFPWSSPLFTSSRWGCYKLLLTSRLVSSTSQSLVNVWYGSHFGDSVITELVVGYCLPERPVAMMIFKTFGYISMFSTLITCDEQLLMNLHSNGASLGIRFRSQCVELPFYNTIAK